MSDVDGSLGTQQPHDELEVQVGFGDVLGRVDVLNTCPPTAPR